MATSVLERALRIAAVGTISLGAVVLPATAANAADPALPEGDWSPGLPEHCFCGAARGIDFTGITPGTPLANSLANETRVPAPLGSVTGEQSWSLLFGAAGSGHYSDSSNTAVRTTAVPDRFIAEGQTVEFNPYAEYSATSGLVTQSVCGLNTPTGAWLTSADYYQAYAFWNPWSYAVFVEGQVDTPRPIPDSGVHYVYSATPDGPWTSLTPPGTLPEGTTIGDPMRPSLLTSFAAETGSPNLTVGAGEIAGDEDYQVMTYTGTALPADAAGYPKEWMDRYVAAHTGDEPHDHDLVNVPSLNAPGTFVSFRVIVVNSSETVNDAIDLRADDSVDVFTNDTLREYAQPVWTSATSPAHGTIEWDGSSVTYTPGPGFPGTDTFTYTVTDELTGHTTTATVTVTGEPGPGPVDPDPDPTDPTDPGTTPTDPEDGAVDVPTTPNPPAEQDTLARTGADPAPGALAAGLGALVAGAAALAARRTRRRRA